MRSEWRVSRWLPKQRVLNMNMRTSALVFLGLLIVGLIFFALTRDGQRTVPSTPNETTVVSPTSKPTRPPEFIRPHSGRKLSATTDGVEPTPDDSWTMYVVNEVTQPIRGAEIWRSLGDSWSIIGSTDEDGRWGSQKALASNLVVTHSDYQSIEVTPDSLVSSSITVVLPDAATLHGRVINSSDEAPASKIRVLAIAADDVQLHRLPTHWISSPLDTIGVSDEQGQFVIHGLDVNTNYYLLAGGAGRCSRGLGPTFSHFDSPVEVRVARMLAFAVEATESDGQPIRLSRSVRGIFSVEHAAELEELSGRDWRLALADVDFGSLFPSDPFVLRSVFLEPKNPTDSLGPSLLWFQLPGYEPIVEERIQLVPLEGDEPVTPVPLVLNPVAAGFGSLIIDLAGLERDGPSLPPDPDALHTAVKLELYNETMQLGMEAYTELEDRLVIDGLPAGDYSVRLRDGRGVYFSHSENAHIGDRQVAQVLFSLADTGGLHIETPDVQSPIEVALVSATRASPSYYGRLFYRPFVLPILACDDYVGTFKFLERGQWKFLDEVSFTVECQVNQSIRLGRKK